MARICTLFEGHYHYGLGALVNSLCRHGFHGEIYAGYRGDIPLWASPIKEVNGCAEFEVAPEVNIRFLKMETKAHFTNIKPEFMLQLWEQHCPEADALFYLDPDIIIKCRWTFFEEWVRCGVALCEDVNSPFYANHPVRRQWECLAASRGLKLQKPVDIYVNGGFVGVHRSEQEFLRIWKAAQEVVEEHVGGRERMNISDRTYVFQKTDQDALNMALMFSDCPTSILGKEGMDFIHGGYTMSHAVGSSKPWRKRMTLEALKGRPPSLADKAYRNNTQHPIQLYSPLQLFWKRMDLRCGAAIGRFIRRS